MALTAGGVGGNSVIVLKAVVPKPPTTQRSIRTVYALPEPIQFF